jgi:hypothetical protein
MNDYVGAMLMQAAADRGANTPGSTGYQRDFAI